MGIIGAFKLGTGEVVEQPLVLTSDMSDIFSMVGLAFFLFLGCEFIIPIAPNVKNQRRNVPLGKSFNCNSHGNYLNPWNAQLH